MNKTMFGIIFVIVIFLSVYAVEAVFFGLIQGYKENALAQCDNMSPLRIQFLVSEVSGSYKFRIKNGDNINTIHVPAVHCLIIEDK